MATEYYYPFDFGGSEWSTHYLASDLVREGHKVTILTPNYGTKKTNVQEGVVVKLFPFFIKNIRQVLTPFWHTNALWNVITLLFLFIELKKGKYDVLHLQGKYFSISGLIAGRLLKVPILLTVRDYQMLCPHGLCLWNSRKSCTFGHFLFNEISKYQMYYMQNSSFIEKLLNYIFSVRLWMISKILAFSAKRLDRVVAISNEQAKIFQKNGFKNIISIYNSFEFSDFQKKPSTENFLLFIGRLTPGKGVEVLLDTFINLRKKLKGLKLFIIGEGILKKSLADKIKKFHLRGQVELLGKIQHTRAINITKQSRLVIVPSLWPEPFGRVALESLSVGVPVVASSRGGLREIVENGKYGVITKPKLKDLEISILQALRKEKIFRDNIEKDIEILKRKFQKKPLESYLELYRGLV